MFRAGQLHACHCPEVTPRWQGAGAGWAAAGGARALRERRALPALCATGAVHDAQVPATNPTQSQFNFVCCRPTRAQFRRAWRSARWAAAPQWWTHHAAAARALRAAAGAWGRRGIRGRVAARDAGRAGAAGARARGGGRSALRCDIASVVPLPPAWRFDGEPEARQWHERVFIHRLKMFHREGSASELHDEPWDGSEPLWCC